MSKGFRNFFITFILALIVFGFLAYKMVPAAVAFFLPDVSGSESTTSDVSGSDTSEDTSTPTESEPPVDQIKGTTFTTLMLGKDMYGNIDAAMLLKVNKETKTYLIISIPTDMQLQIDGVNQKLKTLLNSRDIGFFTEKIFAITGLKINYYAIFDVNGLIKAVDSLGSLNYNIPRDMHYEDPDQGLVIDLKKGTTKLTGEIVSHLLRFVPPSGEEGRLAQQRDVIQSILVQMLTLENISKAPSMVESIIANAETNFTVQAFNNNTELIFKYASFTKQIVQYPGTMNKIGEETYFEPNIAAAISLFQQQK